MPRRLTCPCGVLITGANDDELVEKTQAHLASDHAGLEYEREQILFLAH